MDTASIHNFYEKAVFSAVLEQAQHHPHLQGNDDTLADIACVALNRLPPRYIRHDVDFAFFQTEHERTESERSVQESVEFAFGFVQARNAMRARR
jgi:glutathione S-transferase